MLKNIVLGFLLFCGWLAVLVTIVGLWAMGMMMVWAAYGINGVIVYGIISLAVIFAIGWLL